MDDAANDAAELWRGLYHLKDAVDSAEEAAFTARAMLKALRADGA